MTASLHARAVYLDDCNSMPIGVRRAIDRRNVSRAEEKQEEKDERHGAISAMNAKGTCSFQTSDTPHKPHARETMIGATNRTTAAIRLGCRAGRCNICRGEPNRTHRKLLVGWVVPTKSNFLEL